MKKNLRVFLLAVAMLFSLSNSNVYAKTTSTDITEQSDVTVRSYYADSDSARYKNLSTMTEEEFAEENDPFVGSASISASDETYGDMLTGKAKELYDALEAQGVTAEANDVEYEISCDPDDVAELCEEYGAVITTAMWAYEYDHIDEFTWSQNAISYGANYMSDGTKASVYASMIFTVASSYTADVKTKVDNKVNEIVSGCTATTRYAKLKYYHDWLCNNAEYDDDVAYTDTYGQDTERFYHAHSQVGNLLDGLGVCESYAKSFKIFCIKENIPCLIVESEDHMWNYVKMEDGVWYLVDCTWDDCGAGNTQPVWWEYFLSADKTDEHHTPVDSFPLPEVSTEAYTYSACTGEHSWDDGVVTTEPTCAAEGVKTYTCTACGEMKDEAIAKDDTKHVWDEGKVTTEATCAKEGVKTYTCTLCKKTKTEAIAKDSTNHSWDEGTVTTKATCASKGEKTYKCDWCGETKTEEIAKDPSAHTGNITVINRQEATCGKTGYTGETYCKDCGTLLKDGEIIPATGKHTPNDGVVTEEPDCRYTGTMHYTCTVCSAEWDEEIPIDSTKHHWDEGEETIKATCTTKGQMTYTCTRCDATKTEESAINPDNHDYQLVGKKETTCGDGYTGDWKCSLCGYVIQYGETTRGTGNHTWDSGKITKEATESEEGEKTFTCTVCGETKKETIEKTAHVHVWDEGKVTKEPTCGATGERTYTCTSCAETTIEEIPATGEHTWDEGKVTKTATCISEGEKTYTCTVCEATRTEETEKDSSVHAGATEVKNYVEATCGKDGYTGDTCCADCGAVISKGETIKATGDHFWGEGVVTKEATESEEGEMTYTCTDCGATRTETIDKLDHTHVWNGGTVTKEPTCVDKGEKTYKCTVCEETKVEEIAATGRHTWNDGEITKEATCTVEAEETYTCTVCGKTKTYTTSTDPDKHNPVVSGAIAPTCGAYGYTGDTYCADCGTLLEYGYDIDPTGEHVWDDGVERIAATCTQSGQKTYTCTVCGTTNTVTTDVDPDNHTNVGVVSGTEPTNTSEGYGERDRCYDCGNIVSEATVVERISKAELYLGESYTLTSAENASWSITDGSDCASLDGAVLTAKKAGTVTVCDANSGCDVTFTIKTPVISVNKTSVTIYRGKTFQLVGTATPSAKVTYSLVSSTYKKYATVTTSGLIKASTKYSGTIYIYAKANGVTKKIKVIIKTPTISTKTSVAVKRGKTLQLKATATPTAKVTYSLVSSKYKKYATVSKTGLVKGIKKGTIYIYAKANGVTKKIKVSVK